MRLWWGRQKVELTLIVRVVLALVAVGIIPLSILAVSLVDANRDAMQTQVRRTHAVAADTASSRIEAFLASRRALTRTIAANAELNLDPKSSSSRQLLADFLASDPDLRLVEVMTPKGESVIRVQRRGPAVALVVATLSDTGAGQTILWRAANRAHLLLSEPLADARGHLRTVSDASAVVSALQALGVHDEAEMALLDARGAVILGSVRGADFPPLMKAAARSARVVGSGAFVDAGGSRVLGAYAPVATTGWSVVSRQPAMLAEGLVRALRVRSLLAVAAALALVAVLAYAAYRGIVRPIRQLLSAQRHLVGRGGRGGGEIDQLRGNFELLARRIADQEQLGRTFLGRYQIIDILGEGGMGMVFRGWDPKLERYVALKTIRFGEKAAADSSEDLSALLREAVTIARLSHPNIVSVYDVEDSPDAAFFAMELIDGVTLENLLRARGTLEPGEVVLIGQAVARALDAAHARGILHHDIKPANVLLGRDQSIKVTDFGISDVLSSVASDRNYFFGTPGYVAPEGCRGQKQDQRSDLFSLGVVLHQCLGGTPPFERLSVRETLTAALYAAPRPLRLPAEWEPLQAMIDRLMAKEPKDRPPSAASVAELLTGFAQQRGLSWTLNVPSSAFAELHSTLSSWVPTVNYQET